MQIGFIGLGKLGLPCALAMKKRGHQIFGYDTSLSVKEILDSGIIPYKEEGAQELLSEYSISFLDVDDVVGNSEIIFIAIQTPHDPIFEGSTRIPDERKDFDYSYLVEGVKKVSDAIDRQDENKIVIIISTVLPGTIGREIIPVIKNNRKFYLCYNPFFIAMGTTINDFLNPEFVLFGTQDDWVAERVEEFYKTIHNRPFYRTSIKNAELIKVCYNTFIGMKIVFSNTVMEICHKTGANVDGVMNAIKLADQRLISPKYLNGGMGDGGGCHPRDNIAMSWLANELNLSHNFFDDIMKAREDQTEFLADLITSNPGPYYILGKTFKEESNLITGSPSILLYNILKEKGIEITMWDPQIDKETPEFLPGTYFVSVKHKIFNEFKFPAGSIIIDPLRFLNLNDQNLKYIPVGN
jgi:UDPglucose 6-dehydrogenase